MCFPADGECEKMLSQQNVCSTLMYSRDTRNRYNTKTNAYVSLRLRVQNAVSAQPCVGKFRISLVLFNFLHCNFRLWFETP